MQGLMFDSQLLLHSLLWRTERLFAKKEIITRLGPGERVGSLAWNTYRHLETHFAVPGIQSVLHTTNLRLSPRQQKFTIDKAEDRFLLVAVDQVDQVAELLDMGLNT